MAALVYLARAGIVIIFPSVSYRRRNSDQETRLAIFATLIHIAVRSGDSREYS